jgi:hypothetical protein
MEEWRYSSTVLNLDTMEVSGQLYASATLPLEKQPPPTHCMGGWVGLRAGLDVVEKIKIFCPYRDSNLNSLVVQPIA